jgi:hypothetical protein
MNVPMNHSRLLQFAGILLACTGVALVAAVALATEIMVGVTLLVTECPCLPRARACCCDGSGAGISPFSSP